MTIQWADVQRHVGVEADGKPGPATLRAIARALGISEGAPPRGPVILSDAGSFFAAVRGFVRPLEQRQVDGLNALTAEIAAARWPLAWAAYGLATAYHETGAALWPNVESLNYSESGLLAQFGRHRISEGAARRLGRKPGEGALSEARQREIGNLIYGGTWGATNLGNTEPNDGWTYRGRGLDHCTGRRNYAATGAAIGVDLLANPDALLIAANAARALVTGMETGRYTGRKLADTLPARGAADLAAFVRSRPIINGTDRADDIARVAMRFQGALQKGLWG